MHISVQNGGIIQSVGAEKCYELIAKTGFTGIDWNLDHALRVPVIQSLDYKRVSAFSSSPWRRSLSIIRTNWLSSGRTD